MREKETPEFNEQILEADLSAELDNVAPRRDLWPAVQAGVQHPVQKSPMRRLAPAFGWTAALSLVLLVVVAVTFPMMTTFSGVGESLNAPLMTEHIRPQTTAGAQPTRALRCGNNSGLIPGPIASAKHLGFPPAGRQR